LQYPDIFSYVWLAFVLMLTNLHRPEAKTLCLARFFAKNRLANRASIFFLYFQDSLPNKEFLSQEDEKSTASA
jgi:hypothetical protein